MAHIIKHIGLDLAEDLQKKVLKKKQTGRRGETPSTNSIFNSLLVHVFFSFAKQYPKKKNPEIYMIFHDIPMIFP